MTWLPLYKALAMFVFLLSSMLWKLVGLQNFLIMGLLSALFLWLETQTKVKLHYLDSFWMFILSEVMVFASLLTSCLWFQEKNMIKLSHHLEMPFFGCFLLMGSSMTITAYHHKMDKSDGSTHLFFTILLGIGFMLLQLVEFSECKVDLVNSVYHASCFCTVGLHFSHVLMGLIFLMVLFLFDSSFFGDYYSTLMVWYWHFVDYIWLLVYTIVYLCFMISLNKPLICGIKNMFLYYEYLC